MAMHAESNKLKAKINNTIVTYEKKMEILDNIVKEQIETIEEKKDISGKQI